MSKRSTVTRLRVAATNANSSLRMYWRGALLSVLAATVALTLAAPLLLLTGALDLGSVSTWLDRTWSPQATAASIFQIRALRALLAPLFGAAAGVLGLATITILIGSAARATQRSSEIGIRRAVGASRWALVGMAAIEALLLATVTLLASAGLAVTAFRIARSEWPGVALLPTASSIALVLAGFVATFLLGAMFVLVPARTRTVRVASGPPLELYLAAALLSVGLLVVTASGLLSQHVTGLMTVPSERDGNAVIYRVDAAGATASDYDGLMRALGASPNVETASIASSGVAMGLGEVGGLTTDCGDCFEANMRLPFRLTTAVRHLVSADTFDAIGARVVEGRGITAEDVTGSASVVVVNRALARRHFQHGQPIGRRLQLDGVPGWYTVVGIVEEPAAVGFGASMLPPYAVYLSVMQHRAQQVEVMIRPRPGASVVNLGALVGGRLHATAGTPAAITEAALRASQLAPLRWFARWLAVEGWAGWIIAALGALILIKLWINALTPELGLRRAVGARQRSILFTVVGRATLAGVGGICCAFWFGPGTWQAVTSIVPSLPAWDSSHLFSNGAILLAIAVAAALPGAWRAMRTGPAALIAVDDG